MGGERQFPPCPPGSDGPEEDDFDDAVIIISTDDEEPRLLDIPRDTCDNNAKLNHSSNYVPTLGGVNQMILDPHSFPTYRGSPTYTKITNTVSTTPVFGLCTCKWGN